MREQNSFSGKNRNRIKKETEYEDRRRIKKAAASDRS